MCGLGSSVFSLLPSLFARISGLRRDSRICLDTLRYLGLDITASRAATAPRSTSIARRNTRAIGRRPRDPHHRMSCRLFAHWPGRMNTMARTSVVGVGLTIIVCALLPAVASAQQASASGIAGIVRDTSGAVLPGVTVEASSPALIEKTRSVVTDMEGRYNIVDLRPGTYAVTFTLSGD